VRAVIYSARIVSSLIAVVRICIRGIIIGWIVTVAVAVRHEVAGAIISASKSAPTIRITPVVIVPPSSMTVPPATMPTAIGGGGVKRGKKRD
jgi:hypothetical protein